MEENQKSAHELAAIGQRFNRYFRSKGLTGREVADLLGKTSSLVSQMVNGSRFSSEVLSRIFQVFPDLNADWLLYGTGHMEVYVQQDAHAYQAMLDSLHRDYQRLRKAEPALTNKAVKERSEALKNILDKAFELRVRLLSEEADFYKLVAAL